jgi:hypothetical protein
MTLDAHINSGKNSALGETQGDRRLVSFRLGQPGRDLLRSDDFHTMPHAGSCGVTVLPATAPCF